MIPGDFCLFVFPEVPSLVSSQNIGNLENLYLHILETKAQDSLYHPSLIPLLIIKKSQSLTCPSALFWVLSEILVSSLSEGWTFICLTSWKKVDDLVKALKYWLCSKQIQMSCEVLNISCRKYPGKNTPWG